MSRRRLLLCSEGLGALGGFAAGAGLVAGSRVAVVPTAANPLSEPEIAESVRRAVRAAGYEPFDIDLDVLEGAELVVALEPAAAVVIGGGDPWHLLARAHMSGFGAVLRDRVPAGLPAVGVSAGAMLLAPDLAPVALTSPFTPPAAAARAGVAIAEQLVLPHHDRDGRAERHAEALRRHAHELPLIPLRDDEAVLVTGDDATIVASPLRGTTTALPPRPPLIRSALPGDAAAIGAVLRAAGTEEWGAYLGRETVAADLDRSADHWRDLLRATPPPGVFLVAASGPEVVGITRAVSAPVHNGAHVGELDLLDVHPDHWGEGLGRALLEHATASLAAGGHTEAILWTEERNARPRAIYEAAGWRHDGKRRTRPWADTTITEVQYRRRLG